VNPLAIKSLRLKNFKAIRDTGVIEFSPFTVLIGNNGSGKSSLIEGLETFQMIAEHGLDEAMKRWRGIENIRNRALKKPSEELEEDLPSVDELPEEPDYVAEFGHADEQNTTVVDQTKYQHAIQFEFGWETPDGLLKYLGMINSSPNDDIIFVEHEEIALNAELLQTRLDDGILITVDTGDKTPIVRDESILSVPQRIAHQAQPFGVSIRQWQFALLSPDSMVDPVPRNRTGKRVRLTRNGSNIAEYLLDIRKYDIENETNILSDIIETLRYVLPYAEDLQPDVTKELGRSAYLQLSEDEFKVPGWLLSSGTLRIVALLALLRHPQPPPLIVIEEVENGLDPRTINLIVQEILEATESGRSQVIVTTHSPYLLDLIQLENIIVVERIEGQPTFFRPSDDETMQKWAESFTPGALYTMSQLTRRSE
jgi:predicted ATPase